MTTLTEILDAEVRPQIAPSDTALKETRARRDCVEAAAASFPGTLRTFPSGGLAMGVANAPMTDSDGGMVLDRARYGSLGPDGDGDLPESTVCDVQSHIGPIIREQYPKATVTKMKRGVIVRFGEAIDGDQDPTVDLVVALNRREAPGLWIPNLDAKRWDPSHPERHVELMSSGTSTVRQTRARAVRLAKAWNARFVSPALCSFNIVALSLSFFNSGGDLGVKLTEFLEYSAVSLAAGLTPDPAGVSGSIKCPLGKEKAVVRLAAAASHLRAALDVDGDRDEVLAEVAMVFPSLVSGPAGSKAATAAALRTGTAASLAAAGYSNVKPFARSYGEAG